MLFRPAEEEDQRRAAPTATHSLDMRKVFAKIARDKGMTKEEEEAEWQKFVAAQNKPAASPSPPPDNGPGKSAEI